MLSTPPNKGEWYLTDAFQYMIDKGARIKVVDVEGWHDAGQLETLLATNRTMLEKGRARQPDSLGVGAHIVAPVYIEDGVIIEHSTVGPNVSLGCGSEIRNSTLRDCVIGEQANIRDSMLHDSFIGDGTVIHGVSGAVNVGDQGEVRCDSQGSGV